MLSFMSSSNVTKDDDTAAAVAEPEETTPLVASSAKPDNSNEATATSGDEESGAAAVADVKRPAAATSSTSSAKRQVSFQGDSMDAEEGVGASEHFDNEFAPTESERLEYDEEQRRLSFWASEVHPTYTLNDHMDSLAYKVYTGFSLLSAFLAACMLILNAMSFSVLRDGDFLTDDICRSFVILLDCIFMLVELPGTSQYVPVLQNWAYRGFLYMLTASMSAQVAQSAIYHFGGKVPSILQQLLVLIIYCNGAAVFCCGATYFFMGIFCMKGLMDNLRGKYEEFTGFGNDDNNADDTTSMVSGASSKRSGPSLRTAATAASAAKKLSKGTPVEV